MPALLDARRSVGWRPSHLAAGDPEAGEEHLVCVLERGLTGLRVYHIAEDGTRTKVLETTLLGVRFGNVFSKILSYWHEI